MSRFEFKYVHLLRNFRFETIIYLKIYFIGNWKANNISFIFDILTEKCLDLQGLNLSGWNGLTSDHLKHISTRCEKLQRLDLSSINVSNKSTLSIKINLF